MSCVFCGISAGEIPVQMVYEDEDMMVFPDKNPSAPVHLLFVSRVHGEEFHSVDLAKLAKMLAKVQERIAEHPMPYRVSMNGAGATQVSDHLHIHLLGKLSAERPV